MTSLGLLMVAVGALAVPSGAPAIHPRLRRRLMPAPAHRQSDRGPPMTRAAALWCRRGDGTSDVLVAVRLLAAELAAGARPGDALAAAAVVDVRHRVVFERAADAQRQGGDAAMILRSDADVAFIGHAWAVAASTGAAPADVLARAASDCADRVDVRRAIATALAGARASAAVMAALPVLGLVLGSAMGARPLPTLLGSGAGRMCAVLGLLLDGAGIAWTACIARRAARP